MSMSVQHNEIDSRAFGRGVLSIQDFDKLADFAEFERRYMADYQPGYVSCKLALGDLAGVHQLEVNGFQLIEVQITGDLAVRARDVSAFPYQFEVVKCEQVLDEVLQIAGTAFELDRYSLDPAIGPKLSGRRYQEYVVKSFHAADEELCRLFDPATGRTLAFKTHRRTMPNRAVVLLSAVRPDLSGGGFGFIADDFYFNYFLGIGVTRLQTSCSAEHRVIMQHLLGNLRMRVRSTSAILRNLYH